MSAHGTTADAYVARLREQDQLRERAQWERERQSTTRRPTNRTNRTRTQRVPRVFAEAHIRGPWQIRRVATSERYNSAGWQRDGARRRKDGFATNRPTEDQAIRNLEGPRVVERGAWVGSTVQRKTNRGTTVWTP